MVFWFFVRLDVEYGTAIRLEAIGKVIESFLHVFNKVNYVVRCFCGKNADVFFDINYIFFS